MRFLSPSFKEQKMDRIQAMLEQLVLDSVHP